MGFDRNAAKSEPFPEAWLSMIYEGLSPMQRSELCTDTEK